jgi:hypothetical protein
MEMKEIDSGSKKMKSTYMFAVDNMEGEKGVTSQVWTQEQSRM